jgi:hypothetical protein
MFETGERRISHTYTAPSGATIVVLNVPAVVNQDEDGREDIAFRIDVAERLEDLVNVALAKAVPDEVTAIRFDDSPSFPEADYSLQFKGPDANFVDATVQTWRLVFDKAYTAIKLSIRAAAGKYDGLIRAAALPRVAFLAPGSITMGIRTSDRLKLFPFDDALGDESELAMQLLMKTSLWLDQKADLPSELIGDDRALETLLRAVEELAPQGESLTAVSFHRIGDTEVTSFSKEKRDVARRERIKIKLRSEQDSRQLDLFGVVSRLDVKGAVELRDVSGSLEWKGVTAKCTFESDLLSALLENFGKRVKATVIQKKTPKGWSRTAIVFDLTRIGESVDDYESAEGGPNSGSISRER